MGNHNTIPMKNQMLTTDHEIEKEMINRLEKRKRECWQNQSPYISSNEEWLEIVIKIKELKKLNNS